MDKKGFSRNFRYPSAELRDQVRAVVKERGFRSEQAFLIAACEHEIRQGANIEATEQFEARVAAVLAVGLGGLPLLFAVAPAVASARPLGIGLPWLLLGIAAYPFLFALGDAYVRLAERNVAEFTDLVERPDR